MTDPLQSDVGCGYPLKLFNIVSTVYPCHPVRQVHASMLETEVPKEVEAESCRFLLRFHCTARSWSFQSLDYWFEDYRIDFMCLVHRLNIFDTTAWGKKLAQWHESSIIVKVISGSPQSWHTDGHTSGGTVQGTDWQIPVMPPTLKVIFLSGFEERMCCSFSYIP